MSNLDVALASFWQLARHWQQGEDTKLQMSCEAGTPDILISFTFIILLHLLVK